MKALLTLIFGTLCHGPTAGQFHPYGERSAPPTWPHSFGEKLHYLCSCRSIIYEPESSWREYILGECKSNYAVVLEIQKLAPSDGYLARLLGFVAEADLNDDLKRERFLDAKRHIGNPEWLGTTNQILNLRPDILTKQDLQTVLAAEASDNPKCRSNRKIAERLLATLAIRERKPQRELDGNSPAPSRTLDLTSERNSARDRDDHRKWSLVAGGLLVLAAAAFLIWNRWFRRASDG